MTAAEKPRRQRLDALLVERGLAETRTKAQALIIAGKVFDGNGQRLDKPGTNIAGDRAVEVARPGSSLGLPRRAEAGPRPGCISLSMSAARSAWMWAPPRAASPMCCSPRGAAKVYAVDVGQGQLAWRLRQDPRVAVLERVNARHLTRAQVPDDDRCDRLRRELHRAGDGAAGADVARGAGRGLCWR